jgi:hypothetical protein
MSLLHRLPGQGLSLTFGQDLDHRSPRRPMWTVAETRTPADALWPFFHNLFYNFVIDDENHYQYNREWDPNMESGVKAGGVSFFPMR